MEKINKPRTVAFIFIVFIIAVGMFLTGSLLLRPYDDGSLAPYNSSGNLSFEGKIAATKAYEFISMPEGGLYRENIDEGTFDKIYDGNTSYVNPIENWVYFVSDEKIIRSDYLGLQVDEMVTDIKVNAMSVNGYWVYFTDTDGNLYKMRRDGSNRGQIKTDGKSIIQFTADNRSIVFTASDGMYIMKTDGSDINKLYDGKFTRFSYSSDNLYYSDGKKVYRTFQLVSKIDGSSFPYEEINSGIFNYAFDSEGRGLIYYIADDGLHVRKLYESEENPEEDILVCEVSGVTELYCAGYDIYCYKDDGTVVYVSPDGNYKGTVKALDNLS